MKENQVQSLGLEVPLEEGRATLSNILAWRMPRPVGYSPLEEPGGPQSMGSQRSRTQLAIKHQQQAHKEIGVNVPHDAKDGRVALGLFPPCVPLQNVSFCLLHTLHRYPPWTFCFTGWEYDDFSRAEMLKRSACAPCSIT